MNKPYRVDRQYFEYIKYMNGSRKYGVHINTQSLRPSFLTSPTSAGRSGTAVNSWAALDAQCIAFRPGTLPEPSAWTTIPGGNTRTL